MDPIRLLIADDDEGIIEGLVKLLGLEPGVEVVGIAGDAQAAIRLATQHQPDVALCDINMPGGGGPAACLGIRAAAPATRVVAHSMYDDRGAVMHMVRAGAIGYIVKGSPRDQIISTLDRARKGEATLSGQVASLVINELASHLGALEREGDARRQDLAALRRLAGGEGLEVRFEAIVDLAINTLAGVEAVPSLSPVTGVGGGTLESWVATAAKVGFGGELDLAVARLCLAQVDHLPAGTWIGVNVTPTTLLDPAFAHGLRDMSHGTICLEVAGHAAVDYAKVRRALDGIRGPNVMVAVDGVGGDGAVLRQLAELRPDLVKLDPWVMGRKDGFTLALLEAMTGLANRMGSQLVACGVHDQSDIETLRDLGVRFAQGENVQSLVMTSLAGPSPAPGHTPLSVSR
jgi:DNA-binding NarL/FixJ family response regulator